MSQIVTVTVVTKGHCHGNIIMSRNNHATITKFTITYNPISYFGYTTMDPDPAIPGPMNINLNTT